MKITKRARREARQLFQLCLVNERLDEPRARKVAQLVAATGYRNSPAVLAHFLRLVRLDRARHTAVIESAAPLPLDLRIAIEAGLTRRYGEALAATFAQSPELIGGVRIQVGSDVYDNTIRAGLEALEKSF
ncbi:MAG TPA: F0F1 ATP synthase subunit delta [Candidatus Acidoferrales bacterium]|nr:F0F1 ATP synthase subunit delta [Candidatus Acidoferrales bacterium]